MMNVRQSKISAFTLIEAMVSTLLVIVIGVTIISLMIQTIKTNQFERERVTALNRASQRVEEMKRQLFPTLRGSSTSIKLDTLNTPSVPADDLNGTLVVKLRDRAGNIIASGGPSGSESVHIEVTVNWASRSKIHSQSIHTIMTP